MKITAITAQQKNPNRVNIHIDGKYRFSLDIAQVVDFGIKIGKDIDELTLEDLENEGQFGKLYAQAVEYCWARPHSYREVYDYLYKKTRPARYRNRKGEIKERAGVLVQNVDRVLERLVNKGYLDDYKFCQWWVENRNLTKGSSLRKLRSELMQKGVDPKVIEQVLAESQRSDDIEIQKIIAKKQSKYPDELKLKQYLLRQGFSYDDINSALSKDNAD